MVLEFMKILRTIWIISLGVIAFSGSLVYGQTIAEKKAGLQKTGADLDVQSQQILGRVNVDVSEKRRQLRELYLYVDDLYRTKAPTEEYQDLVGRINALRMEIQALEGAWREHASSISSAEDYALWQQPETTLEQLVIDYGSQDYVYLIPPELGSMKVGISSNLPIPRSSWNEMLTLILAQHGVGVKELNPYLRQLIALESDLAGFKYITSSRKDLQAFPGDTRIAFVLSPIASDVQRLYSFLQKFADTKKTPMQMLGGDIFIIGQVQTVQELLKVYDFMAKSYGGHDYKFIALTKIDAEEMANILNAAFQKTSSSRRVVIKGKERPSFVEEEGGPKIVTLSQVARGLFVMGSQQELRKAEEIIREVESRLSEAREKIVFWYTVKHSDAEELAQVIEKVYALLVNVPLEGPPKEEDKDQEEPLQSFLNRGVPFYAGGLTIVNPGTVEPNLIGTCKKEVDRKNFIVDAKTGAIVMVVETDILPRLRDLLKRLDIPKKMVKIDVLLFEKQMSGRNKFGLNLLKMGDDADNVHRGGLTWYGDSSVTKKGILEFTLSRMKNGWIPAYDFAYNFLISQEDVQVTASPSVMTVNQTQAKIAIVEEISLNTAIFEDTGDQSRLRDAFARQQYGVTITVTPTIHSTADDDKLEKAHITLKTDVTFDQIHPSVSSRNTVTRRNIVNEVRVLDGETVILGGLRRKSMEDGKESIPFLGEIPGVGKLFSVTELNDSSTEMFIFLTPTIVEDTSEVLERIRTEELCQRPGDTPEVIRCLLEARAYEKKCLFEEGIKMLLGRPEEWCPPTCCCEYDGRS